MRRLLIFRVGPERYGLDLTQVQEVVEEPVLHFVPTAPAGMPGAINLHGSIMAVVDLPQLLAVESEGHDPRLVVVDPAVAAIALLVSNLEGAMLVDDEDLLAADDAPVASCIAGRIDAAGGVVNLLDIPALMTRFPTRLDKSGG